MSTHTLTLPNTLERGSYHRYRKFDVNNNSQSKICDFSLNILCYCFLRNHRATRPPPPPPRNGLAKVENLRSGSPSDVFQTMVYVCILYHFILTASYFAAHSICHIRGRKLPCKLLARPPGAIWGPNTLEHVDWRRCAGI